MNLRTSNIPLILLFLTLALGTSAHAGLSEQEKCDSGKLKAASKFAQCRINVDSLAVKKGDKLSAEKKAELQAKCETKLTDAYVKLERKYPATMSGSDDECSAYGDAANLIAALVVAGNAVADGSAGNGGGDVLDPTSDNEALCTGAGGTYDAGTDTCAVDITSDNEALCTGAGGTYDAGTDTCSVDFTDSEQAGCEGANGIWIDGVCCPSVCPDVPPDPACSGVCCELYGW